VLNRFVGRAQPMPARIADGFAWVDVGAHLTFTFGER